MNPSALFNPLSGIRQCHSNGKQLSRGSCTTRHERLLTTSQENVVFNIYFFRFQTLLRELEFKKPQLDELVNTAESLKTDANKLQLQTKGRKMSLRFIYFSEKRIIGSGWQTRKVIVVKVNFWRWNGVKSPDNWGLLKNVSRFAERCRINFAGRGDLIGG